MSRLSCDVVKDLIPSYIDNICSQDSRQIVEEHISSCEDCKNIMELMIKTEFVSHKSDTKQIDYMKKVKTHYKNKNILSFSLLNIFIIVGMFIAIMGYQFIQLEVYFIIFPILILSSYFILSDQMNQSKINKWEIVLSGIGIILLCYSMLISLYFIKNLAGINICGLQSREIGPFLHRQYFVIAIMQMAMYVGRIVVKLKKESTYGIGLIIHLLGCCIVCGLNSLLYNMGDVESYISVVYQLFGILLLECIVVSIIIFLIGIFRKGNKKNDMIPPSTLEVPYHKPVLYCTDIFSSLYFPNINLNCWIIT